MQSSLQDMSESLMTECFEDILRTGELFYSGTITGFLHFLQMDNNIEISSNDAERLCEYISSYLTKLAASRYQLVCHSFD